MKYKRSSKQATQRKSERRIRRYKTLLIRFLPILSVIVVFIGIVTGLWVLMRSPYFTVQQIEIQSDTGYFVYEYQVRDQVSDALGKSLVTLGTEEYRKQLLETYQSLDSVTIEKRLPKTLRVMYVERAPLLIAHSGENSFYIDQTGLAFEVAMLKNTLEIPEIQMKDDHTIQLGDTINPQYIQDILEIVNYDWQTIGLRVIAVEKSLKFVELNMQSLVQVNEPTWSLLLALDKDFHTQVTILEGILKESHLSGKSLELIDLRFKNAVVRYR